MGGGSVDIACLLVSPGLDDREVVGARSVLEVLGLSPHEARHELMRFRRHNLALFERMHPHFKDRATSMALAREGRRQLEEQLAKEREEQGQRRTPGWTE